MNREDQFIPHLIVNDGMAALKFYKEVFGAEEGHNMMAPDGKRLMHGELVLDGHKFFVSDEFRPEEGGAWAKIDLTGTLADATRRVISEVERRKIEQSLKEAAGNRNRAAELLQVSYKTFLAKLREYGLET